LPSRIKAVSFEVLKKRNPTPLVGGIGLLTINPYKEGPNG
jgi:hypothetical protein